jgi:hypothetical protein
MPYIKPEIRGELNPFIDRLIGDIDTVQAWMGGSREGVLSYVITQLIDAFYGHGHYTTLSQGIGVLDCVKEEFRRKRLNVYEDKKCQENGDVYK